MKCPFRKVSCVLFILSITLVSVNAFAELHTGNLYGTVITNQGDALPGVLITLDSTVPYPFEYVTNVTNAVGQFRFLCLPPGVYTVKAELEGFSTKVYPNIIINVTRNTTIQIVFEPAAVEE